MAKSSEINIKFQLTDENFLEAIEWSSSDGPEAGQFKKAKAMLFSLFDEDTKDTLKIDLWTTDMQVMEMDRFFFQTLKALADTYFKATKNSELASKMQYFARHFGEETEIIPKETDN